VHGEAPSDRRSAIPRYRIRFTRRFARSLRKLARDIRRKVKDAVSVVAIRPYSGHFIMTMNVWSYRVGDYRVLYLVNEREKEIILLTVRHRRRAYR